MYDLLFLGIGYVGRYEFWKEKEQSGLNDCWQRLKLKKLEVFLRNVNKSFDKLLLLLACRILCESAPVSITFITTSQGFNYIYFDQYEVEIWNWSAQVIWLDWA